MSPPRPRLSRLRESLARDGFLELPRVLLPAIDRLHEVIGRLEARAATMSASTDDFVLEAEGIGGWSAWQQGTTPVAGLLRSVTHVHKYVPELATIVDDTGIATDIVAPTVGTGVTLLNTFLWAKPARLGSTKPWHQDMAFAPQGFHDSWSGIVTLWTALDPATTANGCLEFVPGSHRHGLYPHIGDEERWAGERRYCVAIEPHVDPDALGSPEVRPVALDTGSAVLFDGMVVHRSRQNSSEAPRRAISFVFGFRRR